MEDWKGGLKIIWIYTLFLPVSMLIFTETVLPDRFPFYALSSLWYMVLFVVLIRYYYERLAGHGPTRRLILACSVLMLFSILLRGMKYSLFYEIDMFRRMLWYMYYIPFLMIPLLLYLAARSIGEEERRPLPLHSRIIVMITLTFIAGVLTNDLHSFFFRFHADFALWDSDYSYGLIFYLLKVWEYILYILAISQMNRKCSLRGRRSIIRMMLIPVFVSVVLIAIIFMDLITVHGMSLLGLVEVKCYMVAAILGLAIESGMIPSKADPQSLLKTSSLAIEITDKKGRNIYHAGSDAERADYEHYVDAEADATDLGDVIVRRYDLGQSYGFWKEDVSGLNRLKEHLSERQEELREENELSRLENALKEKKSHVLERDRIYDQISAKTAYAVDRIYQLTQTAETSGDIEEMRQAGRKICFLGAYIKRFSNLYLHAASEGEIRVMELRLAVQELLLQLQEMGIVCECMADTDTALCAEDALACYELIGRLTGERLHELKGVYIRIQEGEEILLKTSLEGSEVKEEDVQDVLGPLAEHPYSVMYEDGISYLRIVLGRRNAYAPS